MLQKVILACFLAFLTSCAAPKNLKKPTIVSKPVQDFMLFQKSLYGLENWKVSGKISLQHGGRIDVARLMWNKMGDHDLILIYGPAGLGGLRIEKDAARFKVTSGQTVYQAASAEALVKQLYGWDLPLSALPTWMKAVPLPFQPFDQIKNVLGYPAKICQSTWKISYDQYIEIEPDHLVLPTWIKLENDDMKVVIKVQEWSISTHRL